MLSCKLSNVLSTLTVYSLFGYTLPTSLIEYKRLVLRGELVQAVEVFTSIPVEQRSRYESVFSLVLYHFLRVVDL